MNESKTHNQRKMMKFSCPFDMCAMKFTQKESLNHHVANIHTEHLSELDIKQEWDPVEVKSEPLEVKSELMEAEDQMNNFVFCNNYPNLEGEQLPQVKDPLNMPYNVKTEEPEFKPIKKSRKQEFVVKQEHQDELFDI